jgi:hypothetical protein
LNHGTFPVFSTLETWQGGKSSGGEEGQTEKEKQKNSCLIIRKKIHLTNILFLMLMYAAGKLFHLNILYLAQLPSIHMAE